MRGVLRKVKGKARSSKGAPKRLSREANKAKSTREIEPHRFVSTSSKSGWPSSGS